MEARRVCWLSLVDPPPLHTLDPPHCLTDTYKPPSPITANTPAPPPPHQLVGELAPALRLELGQHRLFAVDARGLSDEEPLGQVLLVERLEDVLAVNEPGKTQVTSHRTLF